MCFDSFMKDPDYDIVAATVKNCGCEENKSQFCVYSGLNDNTDCEVCPGIEEYDCYTSDISEEGYADCVEKCVCGAIPFCEAYDTSDPTCVRCTSCIDGYKPNTNILSVTRYMEAMVTSVSQNDDM